jgi:hypothetical protein
MNWRVLGVGTAVLWMVTVGVVGGVVRAGAYQAGGRRADGNSAGAGGAGPRCWRRCGDLLQVGAWGRDGAGEPGPKPQGGGRRGSRGGHGDGGGRQSLPIMLKLPLAFKQLGMSIHKDMDHLADGIAQGESSVQMLSRLSSMTARCTACHDMYRFANNEVAVRCQRSALS